MIKKYFTTIKACTVEAHLKNWIFSMLKNQKEEKFQKWPMKQLMQCGCEFWTNEREVWDGILHNLCTGVMLNIMEVFLCAVCGSCGCIWMIKIRDEEKFQQPGYLKTKECHWIGMDWIITPWSSSQELQPHILHPSNFSANFLNIIKTLRLKTKAITKFGINKPFHIPTYRSWNNLSSPALSNGPQQ